MNWLDFDRVLSWLQDPHNWGGYAALAALAFFAGWWIRRNDPHREERAMARKIEKELKTKILSDALMDAYRAGTITATQMQVWTAECGKKLNLPDMIPQDKPKIIQMVNPVGMKYFVSIPKVFATKTKVAIIGRLNAMGVADIADRLIKQRRYRKQKQNIMKNVKPIKLPQ